MLKKILKYTGITFVVVLVVITAFLVFELTIPFSGSILKKQIVKYDILREVEAEGIALGINYKSLQPKIIIKGVTSKNVLDVRINKINISFFFYKSVAERSLYISSIIVDSVYIRVNSKLLNSIIREKKENKSSNGVKDNSIVNQLNIVPTLERLTNSISYVKYIKFIQISNINLYSVILNKEIFYKIDDIYIDLNFFKEDQFKTTTVQGKLIIDNKLTLENKLNVMLDKNDIITIDNNIQINDLQMLLATLWQQDDIIADFKPYITAEVVLDINTLTYSINGSVETNKGKIKAPFFSEELIFSEMSSKFYTDNKIIKINDLLLNLKSPVVSGNIGLNIPISSVMMNGNISLSDLSFSMKSSLVIEKTILNVDVGVNNSKLDIKVFSDNLRLEYLQKYWPTNYLTVVKSRIEVFNKAKILPKSYLTLGFNNYSLEKLDLFIPIADVEYAFIRNLPSTEDANVHIENILYMDKADIVLQNNDLNVSVWGAHIADFNFGVPEAYFSVKNINIIQDNDDPMEVYAMADTIILPIPKMGFINNGDITFALEVINLISKKEDSSHYGNIIVRDINYVKKNGNNENQPVFLGNINISTSSNLNELLINEGVGTFLGTKITFDRVQTSNQDTAYKIDFVNLDSHKLTKIGVIEAVTEHFLFKGDVSAIIKFSPTTYNIDIFFDKTIFDIPIFNWSKKANTPLILQVQSSSDHFNIEAISSTLNLTYNMGVSLNDNTLDEIHQGDFSIDIDKKTNINGNFIFMNDNNKINISGEALDLSGVNNVFQLLKEMNDFDKDSDESPTSMIIHADIARIKHKKQFLEDVLVDLSYKNEQIERLNVEYINNKSKSNITKIEDIIYANIDNMGNLTYILTGHNKLKNGHLTAEIKLLNNIKDLTGNIVINRVSLPFIGRSNINSSISLQESYLKFNNIVIINRFLGFDLSGYIDFDKEYLDIHGRATLTKLLGGMKFTPYIRGSFNDIKYSIL